MKGKILGLMVGLLLISFNLFAADGDLIVNGNLGIGTMNPGAKLDVQGNLKIGNHYFDANDDGWLRIRDGDNGNFKDLAVGQFWVNSTAYFGNGTGSWDSAGNVGVGTTGPSTKLQVAADSGGYGELYQAHISMSGGSDANKRLSLGFNTAENVGWVQSVYFGVAARPLALQPNGGNVGIGTTNPGGYKLYVNGPAYSTGGWESSDVTLKENIAPIDSPLDKVLHMEGVSYTPKMGKEEMGNIHEGRRYGVIAQGIEGTLPEAVREGPDGKKAVAYAQIIPVLIEAVKEQQKKISELEEKIKKLEGGDK